MSKNTEKDIINFRNRLKWLVLLRLLVTFPLLSAIVFFQADNNIPHQFRLSIFIYGLSGILAISFCYSLIMYHLKKGDTFFAYFQIIVDTFFVTLIIYLTGGFYSIFPFLYFVVIIYSSIMLLGKGSLVMASLCSVQYGVLIDLEYYGVLKPMSGMDHLLAADFVWSVVFYKILFTMISCFAVAILSSLLAIEAKKARKELNAMEEHVKRVDKMAVIGEMAAGLAHEIKNPLASLSGAIQLLKEDSNYDPENDKLMQIALREANRLSSLLNDFLQFARPKTGNPVVLNLNVVLAEVLDLFENDPEIYGKVTVERIFVPDIQIEMDPLHLHQVLLNLLMNAAQSLSENGRIIVRVVLSGDESVNVEIIDNGCGMSPETINLIFDPFYTTRAKGVGLGLSIVHRILDAYNCRLDVTSTEGEGSRFILNFKLCE